MSDDAQPHVPFTQQLRSFGGVYWIANWMELVERFAYYGLRTVVGVFMVLAISEGGPEISHQQKGSLFAIWALVQSFVPIFTGSLADRYGYKLNIALATGFKIAGYLLMCYSTAIAGALAGVDLREARAAGTDLVYELFFAGAMLLALGTAIFKPGVQGLIASRMKKEASSLGWGVFYQMVNIGGFVGPFVAGYLRVLEWEHVFLVCAGGVALNFIPLFFFAEPERPAALQTESVPALMLRTLRGLLEPRVFFFTMAFAGFWLMFYQLFDILPNYIDDWIDTRAARSALVSLTWEQFVPNVNGGNLTQEWVINVNALLISIFAFLVGYLTGRMRSLPAIVIGIALSALGIYGLGTSSSGWVIIGAIALFSVGEMMASPTKMRYFASITPPGQEGQYMGYVNFTVGLGWSIGSVVAGHWYEENGDKINLAKRYLVEHGEMSRSAVDALDRGDVMATFGRVFSVDAWGARELLWNAYEPSRMWTLFTMIGSASMVLLLAYDWVTRRASADPSHSFNTRGQVWVRVALVPIVGAFLYATIFHFTGAVLVLLVMFTLLLLTSFLPRPPASAAPSGSSSATVEREAA
jgi:dipeptide/tripeptide permease